MIRSVGFSIEKFRRAPPGYLYGYLQPRHAPDIEEVAMEETHSVTCPACHSANIIAGVPGHGQEAVEVPGHEQEPMSLPGHGQEAVELPGHGQEHVSPFTCNECGTTFHA